VSIAVEVEQFIISDLAAGRGIESLLHESDLLAEGIIDSLGIVELIAFLEGKYRIAVADDDIDAENFRSVQSIVKFVERKRS
jgi:acyl carrier protein